MLHYLALGRNWVRFVQLPFGGLLGTGGDGGGFLGQPGGCGAGGDQVGQEAALFVDLTRETAFVAGHAVDGLADLVPGGSEVHGGDAALAGGFGERCIVAGEQGAIGVLEGVGLEEPGAGVVEEAGFGSADAAFADFEKAISSMRSRSRGLAG